MKKTNKNNSLVATQNDLQEMTNFIVSTINEMISQQNKKIDKFENKLDGFENKLDGFEEKQNGFEKKQNGFEKKLLEIQKGQKKQLEISLQLVDELKAMREEQAAQVSFNARTNDALETHDGRITTLEQNFAVI